MFNYFENLNIYTLIHILRTQTQKQCNFLNFYERKTIALIELLSFFNYFKLNWYLYSDMINKHYFAKWINENNLQDIDSDYFELSFSKSMKIFTFVKQHYFALISFFMKTICPQENCWLENYLWNESVGWVKPFDRIAEGTCCSLLQYLGSAANVASITFGMKCID